MLHIEINRVEIDPDKKQKWIDKANLLLETLETIIREQTKEDRDKYIDDNNRYWKLFKEHLKLLSYRKCWYSDSINPASHYHVDHFRPKKKVINYDKTERDGYWWLAFDLSNFRLSGSVPNTKKGNHFAVKDHPVVSKGSVRDEIFYFLDPTNSNDVSLINFQEDGLAIESAPENDERWDYQRAKYTIKYLDLNYEDLVEARMVEWGLTSKLIQKINELIKENNDNPSASLRAEIEGLKNQCRQRVASCANFTSTNRACLRASGKRWAYDILGENVDRTYCR
jgi:hypothetical protein